MVQTYRGRFRLSTATSYPTYSTMDYVVPIGTWLHVCYVNVAAVRKGNIVGGEGHFYVGGAEVGIYTGPDAQNTNPPAALLPRGTW